MCSDNFKSKYLKELLDVTEEKAKHKYVVKVREDQTYYPIQYISFVEKSLLTKLQLQNMQKKINDLISSGMKTDHLTQMSNLTNEKMENEFIVKIKVMVVEASPLLIDETARRFLARRKLRIMEKPLLTKLQLQIMHEKIIKELKKRQWKKLQRELVKEYGPSC